MSQSAGRALDLLVAVVSSPKTHGLMELSEQTAIDKSTAARLLGLLVERQFITRDEETQRYSTGAQTYSLFVAIGSQSDIRAIAASHLTKLRDRSGETATLHLRVGKRRVCIDGKESNEPVRRVVPIGETLPLYLGPSGKVILAFLSDPTLASIIAEAKKSGSDTAVLRKQLEDIRNLGYALTESDRTHGVRALCAPIFDARGPIGSITVAGPSDRWTLEGAQKMVSTVLESAHSISSAMGAGGR
jgi:IclR family KDG regulon transcriptional repressor